jgi:hypothetical protein
MPKKPIHPAATPGGNFPKKPSSGPDEPNENIKPPKYIEVVRRRPEEHKQHGQY